MIWYNTQLMFYSILFYSILFYSILLLYCIEDNGLDYLPSPDSLGVRADRTLHIYTWGNQGKRLHTRSHTGAIPLEDATVHGTSSVKIHWKRDNSVENTADKWIHAGKHLKIHWKPPLKIHDEFWGIDFCCAIFFMRNILGWLDTRLAQLTLNYINIA